jgi:hypothetical protein
LGDPQLASDYADAVEQIRELWESFKFKWPRSSSPELQHEALAEVLDKLILEIGFVTVPPRANENLKTMRPGTIMDFDAEFKDEVPSADSRAAILSWMNSHPSALVGVADVDKKKIMAASPYAWRRALSWLLILGVGSLVLVGAANTHWWLDRFSFARAPAKATNQDYVAVVLAAYAGALAHTLIAALKQRQRADTQNGPTFTALGNVALWVHVNEAYLVIYAFAIPAAAFAVVLLNGSVDLIVALLVGYSIDSVLEVLLGRFDKFVAGRTELVATK